MCEGKVKRFSSRPPSGRARRSSKEDDRLVIFLLLPSLVIRRAKCNAAAARMLYLGAYVCARSLARLTIINVVAYSLSPSLSRIAQHICSFYFNPFDDAIAVEASRRRDSDYQTAYVGEKASAQSTSDSERERKEKRSLPMLFFLSLSLPPRLIFSKYTIRSGHSSFVSHSLAYIFKHRRRPPSRALCFFCCAPLFSLLPLSLSPFLVRCLVVIESDEVHILSSFM